MTDHPSSAPWRPTMRDLTDAAWSDLDAFTQGYIEALLGALRVPGPNGPEPLLHPAFRDLALETLARIMVDCRADQRVGFAMNLAGNTEDRASAAAGAAYWRERQTGNLFDAPPLTPILSDDGKVVFA